MFKLTRDDLHRKTDAELADLFNRACHATAEAPDLADAFAKAAAFIQASNALRMIRDEQACRVALRPGPHL